MIATCRQWGMQAAPHKQQKAADKAVASPTWKTYCRAKTGQQGPTCSYRQLMQGVHCRRGCCKGMVAMKPQEGVVKAAAGWACTHQTSTKGEGLSTTAQCTPMWRTVRGALMCPLSYIPGPFLNTVIIDI